MYASRTTILKALDAKIRLLKDQVTSYKQVRAAVESNPQLHQAVPVEALTQEEIHAAVDD